MTTSPWKQPTDFQLLVIAGRLGMWLYKVGEVPASPQAVCLIWFLRNLPLVFYRMDGFSGLPKCPCSHRDVWRKTRYLWVKTRTDHTAKVVCYRMNRANSNRHYPYGKVSVEKQFVSAVYSTYPLAAPKQIPQGVQLLLALHPHSSPHLPSMRIKCVPPVSTRWFRIHRVRVVPMCPRLYVSALGLGKGEKIKLELGLRIATNRDEDTERNLLETHRDGYALGTCRDWGYIRSGTYRYVTFFLYGSSTVFTVFRSASFPFPCRVHPRATRCSEFASIIRTCLGNFHLLFFMTLMVFLTRGQRAGHRS